LIKYDIKPKVMLLNSKQFWTECHNITPRILANCAVR